MPPEHVNRETVERRMDRLQSAYGETFVHEERETVSPAKFEELREIARSGYTGGGYAWVIREPDQAAALTESMPDEVDDGRRALMILGRGGSRWGLAGGGREAGETYDEATVREVREETGIDCEPTGLFLLRRCVTVSTGEADEHLHSLFVFFDAEYESGHIAIQPGELNGAAWFGEPPARLLPENAYRAETFWDGYQTDGDPLAELRDWPGEQD